jgi:four helix bundle protein
MACIAEAAGRWQPAEKRHFYGIARGSATECAAHLDGLQNRKLIQLADYEECRKLLLSIVRILSRLSQPPDAT